MNPTISIQDLRNGSILALSKAITLVESNKKEHRTDAHALLKACMPFSGKSIRIGITGVPGGGKSTFIESFGKLLHSQNRRIAVLAIDPSSSKNRGSILGDKTRMNELSALPNVFIRPSPAGDELGGVHRATRESILLCEAAGYDTIIIETVGVGQSEWAVHNMTDVFLLLAISGAGDELQGIKRGIMEMADIIAINKSDGDNEIKAQQAAQQIRSALHFFSSNEGDWTPRVINCSSLYNQHIDEVWKVIQQFVEHQKIKNIFESNRQKQQLDWFHNSLKNTVINKFLEDKNLVIQEIEAKILSGDISPNEGVDEMIRG